MNSPEESKNEFADYILAHPKLHEVFDSVYHFIKNPSGTSIVPVCGPSGVGKTTLGVKLEHNILSESEAQMRENPGWIPLIRIEAVADDAGDFHWGDFYTRFLEKADEPMLEYKRAGAKLASPEALGKRKKTHAEMRRAMESCIINRGIRTIIIDEAQHLSIVKGSGAKLRWNMDTLKSIANLTKATFVMIGTYETARLLEQSAHLARRTTTVEFPRYKREPKDYGVFAKVVRMFQKRLPLQSEGLLEENLDYLYECTFGCVGTLKDWLKKALAKAQAEQAKSISMAHLKATQFPQRALLQMAQEISEGERRLADDNMTSQRIRQMLDIPDPKEKDAMPQDTSKKQRRNVGERAPKRDKVGAEEETTDVET